MVIVCGVTLSSVYIVAYEFFESVGYGGVVYYFVDEGVDIDGVKCL